MAAGRRATARDSITSGAQIIALTAEKLIKNKEILEKIKEEHKAITAE